MKTLTLTFNSTELKDILDSVLRNRTGELVTYAGLDHGYVDSDAFFKEIDLNTGRYALTEKPKLKYGSLTYPYSQTANFEDILFEHVGKLGYKPVDGIKYFFQVPERTLMEIRNKRDSFYGRIDGKVTVTIEVKPKNIIKLVSSLF